MEGHKRTMKAQGEGACVGTQQQQHIGSAIIERRQTERGARRERSDDIAREKTDGQSEITRER